MEKDVLAATFLCFTLFFWLKENIIALFNYNKRNVVEVNIINFVSIEGRHPEYFCVVKIKGTEYIVKRGVFDKVGENVKVIPTCKYNYNLKKPICYRANFVLIYVDILQLVWFIVGVACSITYCLINK